VRSIFQQKARDWMVEIKYAILIHKNHSLFEYYFACYYSRLVKKGNSNKTRTGIRRPEIESTITEN